MLNRVYDVCVAILNERGTVFKIKNIDVTDECWPKVLDIKELNYENSLGDFIYNNCNGKIFKDNEFLFNEIEQDDFYSKFIVNNTCEEIKEYLSYMERENIFTLEFFDKFKMFKNIVFSYKIYEINEKANVFNINMNIKEAGLIPDKDVNKGYVYTCRGIKEIAFSILHSYIINGYKLIKCEHCGKWFATETYKRKYCNRKSPYSDFQHLDCEQAVRNIRQKLSRRYKNIKTMLEYKRDLNKISDERLDEWLNKANNLRDEIYKKSSIEKIRNYEDFLNDKGVYHGNTRN